MIKLWIYSKNRCEWKDIDVLHTYQDFSFEKRSQGLCILNSHVKKFLKWKESCVIDGILFFLDEKESTLSHFPIKAHIKVGRSSSCDIQLCTNGVSRYHFQIENGFLKDFDSLNGTYVNSKKVSSCELDIQDEIVIANIRMLYFETYIVLDMVDNPYQTMWNKEEDSVYYSSNLKLEMPSIERYDVQMPQIMRPTQKQNLFSAIGPSCMIACSGFISSLLIGYLQKQKLETMFSSLISSITMSITFMVYGLYNRNYLYKAGLKENQKSLATYTTYLSEMYEKGHAAKLIFEKETQEYIRKYINTYKHETRDYVYIGCVETKWCEVSFREISYEYALNDLVQKRNQLIHTLNQCVLQPVFLKENEVCWIEGSAEDSITLFENYLWYTKKYRRWIWLQEFEQMEKIFLNPFCAVHEKTDKDTIVVSFDAEGMQDAYYCLIYVGKNKPSFLYDYHIQTLCASKLSEKRKRYLLMPNEMDFYEQLIKEGVCRKNQYVMKIPVGMDDTNQIVYMDFQNYGPHGLVAGMTGFGKSEFISFLLMMLIWHNAPEKFQYILIDFKGGAFGQPFYEFAHCAGIVTNLDSQSMERFFQSMNYELEKRQRLFLKEKVSDIYDYNKVSSLSHLWIFVDEFAQLKMRYPQFMSQLQEIARIGRSLGIHLVLSTQKPGGIVDDQVWANATWKACFHVSSIQDSREMLQNEMAYHLKHPGDMILQSKNEYQVCRSFYLQKSMLEKSWREINLKKEILKSNMHPGLRVMDALKEQIFALHEKREWVLLPKELPNGVWGILDLPFMQLQKEIKFEHIQLIYSTKEDIVSSLISFFDEEPIYVYGSNKWNDYVNASFFKSRYFSQIHNGICLIFEDDNLNLSLLNTNVIAFVFTNNENTNLKWIHKKYVFDVDNIDEKRLFFDNFHLPSFTSMTLNDNMYVECLYRKVKISNLKNRKKEEITFVLEKNCIGFDSQSDVPVFIDENKKLFVLYMEYEEELDFLKKRLKHLKMGTNWQEEKDVYIIQVDTRLLNEDGFQKAIYASQILWVGYGLKEYGYMLKRKLPYEYFKMVYFKDQNEGVGICE